MVINHVILGAELSSSACGAEDAGGHASVEHKTRRLCHRHTHRKKWIPCCLFARQGSRPRNAPAVPSQISIDELHCCFCFHQAGVKTLSVRLGTSRIFWTCIFLLEVAYAGAIATGLLSTVRQPCLFLPQRDVVTTYTLEYKSLVPAPQSTGLRCNCWMTYDPR